MGLVIQRVSGLTFWDFLHTRIFSRCACPDTDFMVPADKLDRFTTATTQAPAAPRRRSTTASRALTRWGRDLPSGGGGLVSTAHDYARFNAMLLNEANSTARASSSRRPCGSPAPT